MEVPVGVPLEELRRTHSDGISTSPNVLPIQHLVLKTAHCDVLDVSPEGERVQVLPAKRANLSGDDVVRDGIPADVEPTTQAPAHVAPGVEREEVVLFEPERDASMITKELAIL
eukprot:CAMPEP_0171130304 /NCGR_PEP_ID=MMETSP0766_2-20121228/120668_1 /TAXON_ID=439317 /ORGANISM="Gambierdiscus australes, Strain CAWD 149" /LENGTH=113 /DNA_ID=CAMNT_0011593553 /DNA_START=83 /DNA_END=421 /DNA_ORIENTATION=-